jgi:two-component system, OmpR family, sensor kinase
VRVPGRGPRSLTARLLLGVTAVSGLGLAVLLLVGALLLRDYLYDRGSEQVAGLVKAPALSESGFPAARLCEAPVSTGAAADVLPSDFRLTVVGPDGQVRCRVPARSDGPPVPALATLASWGDEARVVDGDGGPWATSVVPVTGGDAAGGYVMVAVSLGEADDTVRRLVLGGLVTGLVVLGALALVGWGVIRVGLRPLTEVREAARGIGRGDLSARVPPGTPGTEVAELATALNTMLEEIEEGFEERAASEGRIRQFAADASHELRTPLTSIKGYAQLYDQLGRPGADPEGAEDLESRRRDVVRRIDLEADRMTSIVEDLMLLARLDQDPALVREEVDLVEVAHDVLASARARHPDRRLDLRVSGPVVVAGDRGRLLQVLDNLVGNSLVHTPGGVTVSVHETATGGELVVVDEGPGMPEEVRAHAFDRFYRADAGRSHESGGSGLGLSIVRALVEAHGGTVDCASSPRGGSSFTVRLPRTPAN